MKTLLCYTSLIIFAYLLVTPKHVVASTLFHNGGAVAEQSKNDIPLATEVTLLADQAYPPFSYVENGELKGLLVDIIAAIDAKMPRYRINLLPMPWHKGKALMKKGEHLGLLGAYFHGHDWPYLYPYSQTILYEDLVTVCSNNANMPANASWPESYRGRKLGTVGSYDGWADYGRRLRAEQVAYFFEFPNMELAFSGLVKNVIDCFIVEPTAYSSHLKQAKEAHKIPDGFTSQITNFLSRNTVHLGYSAPALRANKFPYALDFQRTFDSQLFLLKQQGAFDALYEKHKVPLLRK